LAFLLNTENKQFILEKSPQDINSLVSMAIQNLENWDYSFNRESSAASIYYCWLLELKKRIIANHIQSKQPINYSKELSEELIGLVSTESLRELLQNKSADWCDINNACMDEISASLYASLRELKRKLRTDDLGKWRWGEIHYVEYSHKPFGDIKPASEFVKTRLAIGGSENTVNVANAAKDINGAYRVTFGTSFKQVFDLSKNSISAYIINTGQSGNLMSPFYHNMISDFIEGHVYQYHSESGEPSTINKTSGERKQLYLIPEGEVK